jgi:Fic family protein
MQTPTYTNTNLLIKYLIEYEKALMRIKATKLPYSHRESFHNRLYSEDIRATSELLNEDIGTDKADKIQKGQLLYSDRKELRFYVNYRNALEFIESYSSENMIPATPELLLHINSLLMKGIVEEWEAGKFRDFSEKPSAIYDNWSELRDFHPQLNLNDHFIEIFEWVYSKDNNTHPVIKLMILLYELIDKAPLPSGNQISSILTMSVLAKDLGCNPDNLLSFSNAFNAVNEDIKSAFKLSRTNRDLTTFLEAVLYAVSLENKKLATRYTEYNEVKVKRYKNLSDDLNERQIQILEYMESVESVNRSEIKKMTGVSFMTAYRDLQHMLDLEYIESEGVGRGTTYRVIDNVEHEEEPELEVFGADTEGKMSQD